jgi:predicted glycoside hydrolase/deacetylase ChbG (UPF0249 family)
MNPNNLKIVVNADDFGMSNVVNQAILKSFNNNWISTTTIICNMAGFEEACEIAHSEKILDRIGIHFNITEGKPLTEKLKKLKKFCNNNGEMFKSFKGQTFNSVEKEAVYIELEAQVNKLKKNHINPTHADSHRHSHHFIGTQSLFIALAKNNSIPAVRLRFNYGNLSLQRIIYSKLYNWRLEFAALAKTKYFCEIRNVDKKLLLKNKPFEVMVHPCMGNDGKIVNYREGDDFESLIEKFLPKVPFVTYKSLCENGN